MSAFRIQSDFALLDVQTGRGMLNRVHKHGGRVPVVIHGYVEYAYGNFDGESQEFVVSVTSVEAGQPVQKS